MKDGTEFKVAPKVTTATKTIAKSTSCRTKEASIFILIFGLYSNESKENEETCEVGRKMNKTMKKENLLVRFETIEVVEELKKGRQTNNNR